MMRDHALIEELLSIRVLDGLDGDDVAVLRREMDAHGDCADGAFHLEWLYAAFGLPAALLLLRAFGAWNRVEPPAPRSRVLRLWETGA